MPWQCLVFKTMSCLQDNVLSSRQCLVLRQCLDFNKISCLQDNVLYSRQFLVFNKISCLQDNVLSSRQCLVFKTLSCIQDNVLFKTMSCLQDNVLSSRECFVFGLCSFVFCLLSFVFALLSFVFCLWSSVFGLAWMLELPKKGGLEPNFVLPKMICLGPPVPAVPTFCRPDHLPQQGLWHASRLSVGFGLSFISRSLHPHNKSFKIKQQQQHFRKYILYSIIYYI